MIAKIAVEAAIFAIDRPYSYRIPPSFSVFPGQRVVVPFGRGNKRSEGIVLSVEEGDEAALKPIEQCLDTEAFLTSDMLRIAAFMRSRYFCTYYDAAHAILPAGLWFTAKERYTVCAPEADFIALSSEKPELLLLWQLLSERGGSVSRMEILQGLSSEKNPEQLLRFAAERGLVSDCCDYNRKTNEKTESIVSLAVSAEDALSYAESHGRSAAVQAEVLRLLCSVGKASGKDLRYFTGATAATFRRLQNLGLITLSDQKVLRSPVPKSVPKADPIRLSEEQQTVFNALCRELTHPTKPVLLHGVTGSGKTSVYIRLIEQCLSHGKSVMLLVPEIALTPQLMNKMLAFFGERVAILHSELKITERFDEWNRVRLGKASVVVGTRSAVFAPMRELGLIILDEEQEHSYKSENSPRYHAREIAIFRGSREKALVLFGSATPSLECRYHAQQGEYLYLTLKQRFNRHQLPTVEFADMRTELKAGNSGCISELLAARLSDCLEAGHQAILFLNRRGNSHNLVCVECGDAPGCPRCSVKLTYHSANHKLMCHYCGYFEQANEVCPTCGGHLKLVGAGTQRVENELKEQFPQASVLRMDADTVSVINTHEVILKKFAERKADILIGTQMVAKGLDFENVTLVGVMDADQSLYVNQFRAAETTFSMLTQVIGRAGRGSSVGRAVIQTMTPEHSVLRLAAGQDYEGFFAGELALRKEHSLPPFSDHIRITVTGMLESAVITGATLMRSWLAQMLRRDHSGVEVTLLGPVAAPVCKINQVYHYCISLYGALEKPVRESVAHLLRCFAKEKTCAGVHAFADWNPYE